MEETVISLISSLIPLIIISLFVFKLISWAKKASKNPALNKIMKLKDMSPTERMKAIEEMKKEGEFEKIKKGLGVKTPEAKDGIFENKELGKFKYEKELKFSKGSIKKAPSVHVDPMTKEKILQFLRLGAGAFVGLVVYLVYRAFS
ncbi:MAG: hypothetical protein GF349_03915 [Candidatus Magasanikbacteria bacterium]|nr:hypothetical protein [Candidatus Magasanikbacteria bacterium]